MRIAYLATADARGHLMRAQLLAHALQAEGARVQMLTTSDEGARFLQGFGIGAPVLSRHYAVQFDPRQNMLRRETDRNVAQYVFRPERMLRDIGRLRRWVDDADLVINDSFHPALLFMGCLPGWRRKVVHVYGSSLRHALESNFQGRLPESVAGVFQKIVAWQIKSARARLEHDFAYTGLERDEEETFRLPTPVALARHRIGAAAAAVYLNPHFRDPLLADGLEQGLRMAGLPAFCVGEGFGDRPGWVRQDKDWVSVAANGEIVVSAPGMAALTVAKIYGKPILLIVTDQPEQLINALRAAACGLEHRVVVWRGDIQAFSDEIEAACGQLISGARARLPLDLGNERAAERLRNWVSVIMVLARNRPS